MNMRSSSAGTGVSRSDPQVAYYSYWGRASRSGLGKVGTEDLRDSRETHRVGDKFFLCVYLGHFLYMTLLFLFSTLSLIFFIRFHSPPRLRVGPS